MNPIRFGNNGGAIPVIASRKVFDDALAAARTAEPDPNTPGPMEIFERALESARKVGLPETQEQEIKDK